MASRAGWCADQISQLGQEDLRIPTLNDMKDHLSILPHEEVVQTVQHLDLSMVFDCLNDPRKEQVDLASHVLTLCMSNMKPGDSIRKYSVQLERALQHIFPSVKLMTLKEIEHSIKDKSVLSDLSNRTFILNTLIKCISDDDLSVAKKAADIIAEIGKERDGARHLLSGNLLTTIQQVMKMSEVIRLRVYEVLVNMCKDSDESYDLVRSTGILSQIVSELDNNDALFKMNIIEILAQLGLSKHGFNFLESNHVIEKQMEWFESSDAVSLQLCEPGLLKFFGHIARWKPTEVLKKYPKVVEHIFANLESEDLTILGVTYDIIGHIGSTNDGKFALAATGNKIEKAISTVAKSINSLPTEIKVRALSCIEHLLRVTEFNSQVTTLTSKWYRQIDDAPMNFILRYAKNPFYELRLAGFGILHAIAEQEWGQVEIRNTAGLIEFLMDRQVENKKDCKEAKYNICQILSKSSVFDYLSKDRLSNFVKEGPYFVETITEVAIEGD